MTHEAEVEAEVVVVVVEEEEGGGEGKRGRCSVLAVEETQAAAKMVEVVAPPG